MKKYLIKITPLEPFTFGGENGFSFEEIGYTGTYYMRSALLPEQTTIIGMIRYLMLKSEGKLKSSFSYSDKEKEEIAVICGAETFSFEPQKEQDFGYIKEISPLFILDRKGNIYIKNPYGNIVREDEIEEKSQEKAVKMMRLDSQIESSLGNSFKFPINNEEGFIAKKGHGSGYICISKNTGEAGRLKSEDSFFDSQMIAGNKKSEGDNQDGFFRREAIRMKDNASFGIYLSLDDNAKELPPREVVYMGKKKAAFQIEPVKVSENTSLEQQTEDFFDGYGIAEPWYYCLSDAFPEGRTDYKNFAIVETKLIRNLKTVYSEKGMSRKGQKRYSLVVAGSVFYGELPDSLQKDTLKKAGYNKIIKIGGR